MAFERIAIAIGKTKAEAGISITSRGKTVVALRKDLVAAAKFKKDGKFTVLLGSDEDAGRLRIVRDDKGVPIARELKRTGAFFFNLGPVPAIGLVQRKQKPARPRPTPVALSFLVDRLWDGKPPGTAGTMVSQMANDLKKSLACIGLNLNHVKGVGYQLKDA